MSELLPGLWSAEALVGLAWLALAGGVLSLILATGRRIGRRLNLRLWGVPEALVAGLIARIIVMPSGLLAQTALADRLLTCVVALLAYRLARRNMFAGLLAGVVFFVGAEALRAQFF